MILSGIFPTSYGKLLVSGGELFLNAKQNGIELHITDTNHIKVKIPYDGKDTNAMYVFYSDSSSLYSKTNSTGWGTKKQITTRLDSLGIFSYYFPIENMKWLNCDYNWGSLPLTLVKINTRIQASTSKTPLFLYPLRE